MPDQDQAKPKVGETERSFEAGEAGGYQADAFSRNDEEGVPADDSSQPDSVTDAEPILEAGAADGYQTDTFSRGDEEGVPAEDLRAPPPTAAGKPSAEAAPEATHRKPTDDADSRDAPPMAPREGGVR